jgi:hypothetical protein
MRAQWCATLTVCVLASGAGRADDQAELRAVVDRAIQAQGGRELLSKYKAYQAKDKGTFHGMGVPIPYTGEFTFQGADQHRLAVEGEVNGQKFKFVKVLNKDKGWFSIMGMTQEMDKEKLAEEREQTYAGWLTTLVPLQDKAFTLAPAGQVLVDAQPAIGVRVSREGHRDVTLYFDKKTHLLVKTEARVKEDNGMEVTEETFYSDYKGDGGGKQPYKLVIKHDGKLHVESEITEYKALEQAEDGTFDKP